MEGKRQCVFEGQCMSQCGKSEFCDDEHKCKAPMECNTNADCNTDKGMICKSYSSNGLKTCSLPVNLIGEPECRTSAECTGRDPKKPICKKGSRGNICVTPEQCLGNCSSTAVCTNKLKCTKPPTCL